MADDLLTLTPAGLYCPAGQFFIDPWRPVARAVLTHAHADHARWGSEQYLVVDEGEAVFRIRLGDKAVIDSVAYGQRIEHQGVTVSLHPAGHILGSAQVRIEHRGQVAVVSGDYKTEPDPTCRPFEPVRCHRFVTESTFGLPIYRWRPQSEVWAEVNAWWRDNAAAGRASLLYAYALGKSQRLLAGLDPSVGEICTHGAVEKLVAAYRQAGVTLPPTRYAAAERGRSWAGAMILAPPSAQGTTWVRRFGPSSSAMASGWMTIRGTRRRKALDRGFVLSDHADWPGLLQAITATRAEEVWVTHGYSAVLSRWLRERGLDARVLETQFMGEADEPAEGETTEPQASDESRHGSSNLGDVNS